MVVEIAASLCSARWACSQILTVFIIMQDSPTSWPKSDPDFHVPILFGLEFQENVRFLVMFMSLCAEYQLGPFLSGNLSDRVWGRTSWDSDMQVNAMWRYCDGNICGGWQWAERAQWAKEWAANSGNLHSCHAQLVISKMDWAAWLTHNFQITLF